MADVAPPEGQISEIKLDNDVVPSSKNGDSTRRKKRKILRLSRIKDVSWIQLWEEFKSWMKHPLNVGLIFWCILSFAPLVVSQLVTWGFLNHVIKSEGTREQWKETCEQILNALSVLMCLVWHPSFCIALYKNYRWSDKDAADLRAEYSAGGTAKPNERLHLWVVLFFIHLACFATYANAAIFWVYGIGERPMGLFFATMAISLIAPIIGFGYHMWSPLCRGPPVTSAESKDESSQKKVCKNLNDRDGDSFVDIDLQQPVKNPRWGGSLFGCLAEPHLCCLTTCCFFYVFGSTLQRLGFGNKYMQAMTFFLVCYGPYLVFSVSMNYITNKDMRWFMLWLGISLGVIGSIMFGGCWRITIREKFKLPPGGRWCCWSARATDCVTWTLFGCCAACQEARTAKQYDGAIDGSFYVVISKEDLVPNVVPSEPWQHHLVQAPPKMQMLSSAPSNDE